MVKENLQEFKQHLSLFRVLNKSSILPRKTEKQDAGK